jgi:hypothetical protein
MPDKPTWCGNLPAIAQQFRELPDPWVDRGTLQRALGVGPRRAQQILAPCVGRRVGANGVADREVLLAHLHRLTSGEAAHYEEKRRLRLAERMRQLQEERRRSVLVEAPVAVRNQELGKLPEGVSIAPGQIVVSFGSTRDALEKLLALAMAVGNDPLLFERLATGNR